MRRNTMKSRKQRFAAGWLVDQYDSAGYRMSLDDVVSDLKNWRPEDGILPLRDAGQAIRANDIVPRDISGAIQLLDAGMLEDAKVLINATIQDLEQIRNIRRDAPVEEHHLYTIIGAFNKKYGRGVPMRTGRRGKLCRRA